MRDLAAVAATWVAHITQYGVYLAGRTDFVRNRWGELPSIEGNLKMYRIGNSVLEDCGYTQVTPLRLRAAPGRAGAELVSVRRAVLFRKPFASSPSWPSYTSRMMPVAMNCLLTDAIL